MGWSCANAGLRQHLLQLLTATRAMRAYCDVWRRWAHVCMVGGLELDMLRVASTSDPVLSYPAVAVAVPNLGRGQCAGGAAYQQQKRCEHAGVHGCCRSCGYSGLALTAGPRSAIGEALQAWAAMGWHAGGQGVLSRCDWYGGTCVAGPPCCFGRMHVQPLSTIAPSHAASDFLLSATPAHSSSVSMLPHSADIGQMCVA